jgi:hypothetical protein
MLGDMATLQERIIAALNESSGLSDRELTDRILGPATPQQQINQAANALAKRGAVIRRTRADGRIGNFPVEDQMQPPSEDVSGAPTMGASGNMLSEDEVKKTLERWLREKGWNVQVAWGRQQGVDIEAQRSGKRWLIEAKGCGSLAPMRVNYFLCMLGELLQRMDDPQARYSIALPDLKQYRGLWSRLPRLAKERTGIGAIFIAPSGEVAEES